MEDCNLLAADCVVISCCCQCLVLQFLVFVLRKLATKTREYARKMFCQRKGSYRGMQQREIDLYKDVLVRIHEQSLRIQAQKDDAGHNNSSCCMEEVEKVMEEFYQNGEFAFGSFWGRKGPCGLDPPIVNDHNCNNFAQYEMIDLVGSLSYA